MVSRQMGSGGLCRGLSGEGRGRIIIIIFLAGRPEEAVLTRQVDRLVSVLRFGVRDSLDGTIHHTEFTEKNTETRK